MTNNYSSKTDQAGDSNAMDPTFDGICGIGGEFNKMQKIDIENSSANEETLEVGVTEGSVGLLIQRPAR